MKLSGTDGSSSADDLMLCAAFSQIAYENKKETDKIWGSENATYGDWFSAVVVAGGWERANTFQDIPSGLYVVAFRNTATKQVIIAFRGTQAIDVAGDDWADAAMINAKVTAQFEKAMEYYQEWKRQVPDAKILLTGHSLGGALAAYVSMCTGERAIAINGAVGFAIDMAYSAKDISNGAVMAKAFTGTGGWNFENHVTITGSGVNKWVAYPNMEHYDSYLHANAGLGK